MKPAKDFVHDFLFIRSADAKGRSHGDFQWPLEAGEGGRVSASDPNRWVIDDRAHYDWPAGGHQAPLQLGAVVAECPTSFGAHTIRDRSTIGKPCPTVAEGDAIGLQHAYICKAAPLLLRELKKARELVRLVTVRQVVNAGDLAIEAAGLNPWCLAEGLATGEERIDVWSIDDVIAIAEGAPSDDDVIYSKPHP